MMKKHILYILVLIFFAACEKDDVKEYINKSEISDIIDLKLYPNSPILFANGISELEFTIRAYGGYKRYEEVKKIINGETVYQDSLVVDTFLIKQDRLPLGGIKIHQEDGSVLPDGIFTIASGAGSIVTFYASAGERESELIEVALLDTPTETYEEVIIPLVFHVVKTFDTRDFCDAITSEMLKAKLDHMNLAFANQIHPDPNSIDSKIRFEMAKYNLDGKLLAEPGINRVDIGDADYEKSLEYIDQNLKWDPSKYVNIWISKFDRWNSNVLIDYPNYISNNIDVLPFTNKYNVLTQVDDLSSITLEDAELVDFGFAIRPRRVDDINLEPLIGQYLGLLPTEYRSNYYTPVVSADVDFCSDTYTYDYRSDGRLKRTHDDVDENEVYYKSYNIMDKPSSLSSASYEQVKRMRTVLEYCNFRQAYQSDWALTGQE